MAYAGTKNVIDRDYYGTPPDYVQLARSVMGSIELDPASCLEANRAFVMADRFYSIEDDGLSRSWKCETLWLNPPYSSKGAYEFARKFQDESPNIKQAVVLVNSATGTRAFRHLFDSCDAICFCNKRIQFLDPTGERSQSNNSKEQLFFYKGRRLLKFKNRFGSIGRIVRTR